MSNQLDLFGGDAGILASLGPLRALRRIAASEARETHGRFYEGHFAALPGSMPGWRLYCHRYSRFVRPVHRKEWQGRRLAA